MAWHVTDIVEVDSKGEKYIHITAELDGEARVIIMRPEAIAYRQLMYNLADNQKEEALDAILREHEVRLKDITPSGSTKAELCGGLHPGIAITKATAARTKALDVLSRVPNKAQLRPARGH